MTVFRGQIVGPNGIDYYSKKESAVAYSDHQILEFFGTK